MPLLMIAVFLLSGLRGTVFAQTTYITAENALKLHFNLSEEIIEENKQLNANQLSNLQSKLGYPVKENWRIYIAKTTKKTDGYAIIDNEIGKTDPITMMIFFDSHGLVTGVEILVYRESYGSEVTGTHWRQQFIGKKNNDPLKIGIDISNMTGATLSSRAVTKTVKRDLAIWNILYGNSL